MEQAIQQPRSKKDLSNMLELTYLNQMIIKEDYENLKNELNYSNYLLLILLLSSLQFFKKVKLEVLAESLPLPILFESRRRKFRRFLRLEKCK